MDPSIQDTAPHAPALIAMMHAATTRLRDISTEQWLAGAIGSGLTIVGGAIVSFIIGVPQLVSDGQVMKSDIKALRTDTTSLAQHRDDDRDKFADIKTDIRVLQEQVSTLRNNQQNVIERLNKGKL